MPLNVIAFGDRQNPLELLQPGLDPAVGPERPVIAVGAWFA